jgi:hypothetical protein
MENTATGNKPFILKIALLYCCIFASVWASKSQASVSVALTYFSKVELLDAAPLLIQMLNKWYFMGF